MKLATYRDGSRDGQLVVVSRDLRQAHFATGIASRLQQVLDDWSFLAPQLQQLSQQLNQGRAPQAFAFDPTQCLAPLPRAYQWIGSSAYPAHRQLQAETAVALTDPLLYQGSGDNFLGACEDLVVPSMAMGIDFESQLAVISGELALGCTPEQALGGVRLVMLANATCLRQMPAGSLLARPATAFSPVALTLDELTESWKNGRLELTVQTSWNGRKVGMCEAGEDLGFHFGQLLAQLCKTRALRSGSVLGTGPISHPGVSVGRGKDKRLEWPRGYSCIADKRAMERLQGDGQVSTEFMRFGDSLRIDAKGRDGHSLFGAIDQTVVSPQGEGAA